MVVTWKACGITRPEDARAAAAAGADAVGLVFYPPSPRHLELEAARRVVDAVPDGVVKVGVFVDAPPARMEELAGALALDVLQLSGDEDPGTCRALSLPVWKALRWSDGTAPEEAEADAGRYAGCTLLVDSGEGGYGGTGTRADWSLAARLARSRRVVLAGGLRADNVAAAVEAVRPWGIDVSSGLESSPGRKEPDLLEEFARALEPYR